jgi:hypothetical protein
MNDGIKISHRFEFFEELMAVDAWCFQQFGHNLNDWRVDYIDFFTRPLVAIYVFRKREDAMLFKLRWT